METLDDFIVQEALKEGIIKELEVQEEGVNRNLASLRAEDLPTDIGTLRKIVTSEDAFAKWIDKAEASYIGKLGFIPKEERKRIKKTFLDLKERTASARNTVGNFLQAEKYPIIQDSDGTLHYDRAEVDRILTERFTKRFTDEDKEYFQVLQEAKEVLRRLSDWEKVHLYVPLQYCAQNVGKFLIEEFSKDWFCNAIGIRIGKMNPKAIRMLEEQNNED